METDRNRTSSAIHYHAGEHENCPYLATRIGSWDFFCNKCGTTWREVPSLVEHGEEAVLERDFYRCPNTGEWVYKWADERLVLRLDSGSDRTPG